VHFHAVETGFEGQLGALGVLLHHFGHFLGSEGAGRGLVLHLLLVGPHLTFGGDGGGGHAFGTLGQVEGVEHAAGVHELDENVAAVVVYGLRDALPVGGLLLVEQAGNAGVAQAVGRGRHAFGDDEAGGGALAVVLSHQLVGEVA
jgi:hypothetical protein